ncbi:MAG: hypothetical protein HY735_00115, partial [Verrucomicrobia bacterium]|nr:hypothetical protein [Verrucomicrobiota bacterium]
MPLLRICRNQILPCLCFIYLASLVGPNSKAFAACGVAKGGKVQVINTGTLGLRVRECAGTSCAQTGGKFDGDQGTVEDGPQTANGFTWWKIRWQDNTVGWSAEAISGTCVLKAESVSVALPTVQTLAATPVGSTSATIRGKTVSDGGSAIVERRFDWGTGTPLNQVVPNSAVSPSGNEFSTTLTQLTPGTTYYFRAWAKNGSTASLAGISPGWSYGDILTFKTTVECTYAISANQRTHSASAENGNVGVTAPGGCAWTATASHNWITLTSANGNGNGTVTYSVSANPNPDQRVGVINIQGQVFTITQQAAACSYTLVPTSRAHGAGAESDTLSVTTSAGCAWTASASANWITITSGSSGSGSGTVRYSVAANTGASARNGTITVQGQSFSITQAGVSCSYAISPASRTHGAGAEENSFNVLTADGCAWTANTSDIWITVKTANGSGNGTISYSVAINPGTTERKGTITVQGQTFAVTQAAQTVSSGPIRLRAPWDKPGDAKPDGTSVTQTQYWAPQSYDQHMTPPYAAGWDSARRGVDFYYASPQQPGVIYWGGGRGLNVRATHDGTATTTKQSCEGKDYYLLTIVSSDGTFRTQYLHHNPSGKQSGSVKAGEIVGTVDSLGCAANPHLMMIVSRKDSTEVGGWRTLPLDDPGEVLLDGEVILSKSRTLRAATVKDGNIYDFLSLPGNSALKRGDRVRVINRSDGLPVRSCGNTTCDPPLAKMTDGKTGVILNGPKIEEDPKNLWVWYEIKWEDNPTNPTTGWSAQGDSSKMWLERTSSTPEPNPTPPASVTATHASNGYLPGGTVTITSTVTFSGQPSALAFEAQIPAGWSYAFGINEPSGIKPAAGDAGTLEWAWLDLPMSPATFSYTLNVPPGESGGKQLKAAVIVLEGGQSRKVSVTPDPLLVTVRAVYHSADTDQNWKISLTEVLRVIGLFNYRSGTTRTGEYHAETGTVDGYNPGPGSQTGRPHSADTDKNWKIALTEVLRVIGLFNYRSGTTRTGEYHEQAGTVDGYAPGPRGTVANSISRQRAISLMSPSVLTATQTAGAATYSASGGTITINCEIAYTGSLSGLAWEAQIPPGWSYVSGANEPASGIKPQVGDTGNLSWAWIDIPPSSVKFSYTLKIPAGEAGEKTITATVTLQETGQPRTMNPAPLALRPDNAPLGPPAEPLEVVLTANTDSVRSGDTVIYTLSVANRGRTTLDRVMMQSRLSELSVLVSNPGDLTGGGYWSDGAGNPIPSWQGGFVPGRLAGWSVGSLEPGQIWRATMRVVMGSSGSSLKNG